ncbi:MAG: hypothetical protein WAU70_12795 [Flavobacteriales bacterium]
MPIALRISTGQRKRFKLSALLLVASLVGAFWASGINATSRTQVMEFAVVLDALVLVTLAWMALRSYERRMR